MKDLKDTNSLYIENAILVEEMYQLYLKEPQSIDKTWLDFFADYHEETPSITRTTAKIINEQSSSSPASQSTKVTSIEAKLSSHDLTPIAQEIIYRYRKLGHLAANLDPLKLEKLPTKEALKLKAENFGLSPDQMNLEINIPLVARNEKSITFGNLINYLEQTYCSTTGLECDHVSSFEEYEWITTEFELLNITHILPSDEKTRALKILFQAELFEQFLHTKFPGATRFSIEGGETSLVSLNEIIECCSLEGVKSFTIGMAHRGRLNNLVNVMNMPYKAIIAEFLGTSSFCEEHGLRGDVKYHVGYSTNKALDNGKIVHLSMTANPSHLEAVNALVMGQVRAKQDIEQNKSTSIGILIHGDAAFSGQGVVAENLIMSGINAYNTDGIIHIIVNNQIGFTANPIDAHTGRYSTDFAKIIAAPILHVNGDDVEAVIKASKLVVAYRNKFKKDIVLDIVCYRKYGHNEGDEPTYTQVNMYKAINSKETTPTIYANKLLNENITSSEYLAELQQNFKQILNTEFDEAKTYKPITQAFTDRWEGFVQNDASNHSTFITGVDKKLLLSLGSKLCTIPDSFNLHPKLKLLFNNRRTIIEQDQPIDWATAEQLAFSSLLLEGTPVRLTGQDSGRGTFSQRHSVLFDQKDGSPYTPLNDLSKGQAKYFVADSNLSEYSVLGFEYGYSLVSPQSLVIWEAQYGDFFNGAQIIIDQFIASSETKWLRQSGLVVLLPHGFEGQGPEHSSARLERFLQLCAEGNMQITYPTTPASIFHLLRRQLNPHSRAPLIVMAPKSLLRNKMATSNLEELAEGTKFIPVLDEKNLITNANKIERIICCSGKIYYELCEARNQQKNINTVIIRFEQLYPFPYEAIEKILQNYNNLKEFIWCQEEPQNMGAWQFIKDYLNDLILTRKKNSLFKYVGREAAASPSTGYVSIHKKEQKAIINQALNIKDEVI